MKKILLKALETILGSIGVAVVLWIWFSPSPPHGPIQGSSYYASRADFEALVREPDEEQKALERTLETLHQDR